MPEEPGIVLKTYGDKALVRTKRNSMCGECGHSGACHMLLSGSDVMEVEALNRAEAKDGDCVVLELSDKAFLSASTAVYLVPVAGFVAGAFAGNAAGGALGGDADLWAFFGGLAACAAMLALVRFTLRLFPGHERALLPIISSKRSSVPEEIRNLTDENGSGSD
ncbi:MAG: SoxR reducing system RseC family protein [bacterium]